MQQQAVGARQVSVDRRNFADRRTVAKQVNAHPISHSDLLMKASQKISVCVKVGFGQEVGMLLATRSIGDWFTC